MNEFREWYYNGYLVSTDKSKLSVDSIKNLLSASYWAKNRTLDVILKSIENSVCYGIYDGGEQVGFARVVSDFATMYWIGDVYIDQKYRKRGLGKLLIKCIVETDAFRNLRGVLATQDAHGLYEKFGFQTVNGKYMVRVPSEEA